MAALGVSVREGARVTAIDEQGVVMQVEGGEGCRADRDLGRRGAGGRLAKTLAEATGADTDRAGRVQIEPDQRFQAIQRSP